MSQSSTSTTQWIRHAIAAAKGGSPSVAKVQLQKAAEEDPSDPTIWLWLGWLADSPASAVQCLELAQADARFRKVATAGIEFTRALAAFRLDDTSMVVTSEDSEEDVVEDDVPARNPVASVEEVAAAVEALQLDDAELEVVADVPEASEGVSSLSDSEAADQDELHDQDVVQPADREVQADGHTVDEAVVDNLPVDEMTSENTVDENAFPGDVESGETFEDVRDVEAELMKSASELWQLDEEVTAGDEAEQSVDNEQDEQQFWKTASSDSPLSLDTTTTVESASAIEKSSEVGDDDAEEDFVFAAESDAEFETASSGDTQPAAHDETEVSSKPAEDQWLGHAPAEAAQAPVWRKAQSDWFSVTGTSDTKPQSATQQGLARRPSPFVSTETDIEDSVADAINIPTERRPQAVGGQHSASPDVAEPTVDESSVIASVTAQQVENLTPGTKSEATELPAAQPATPPMQASRVTASDVWQKAAIEKSTMPGYVRQPSTVVSVADPALFSADDSVTESFPVNGPGATETPGQKTVLVVDDSPTVRKLVSITLEKRGYKVVSAFDGVAAIKEIAAHNPSMILMDVNMPRLDGYQLCKLVKKHETTRDIPVLMLTGNDGMFDRLRGRLVGCAGYVAKPFAPECLVEAVERHMNQRQGS